MSLFASLMLNIIAGLHPPLAIALLIVCVVDVLSLDKE